MVIVVAIIGGASSAEPSSQASSASPVVPADSAERATAGSVTSRDHDRPASTPARPAPGSTLQAQELWAGPSPASLTPAAGLNQSQMDNAVAIVEAGRERNLPRRAFVVAIATALQESDLRVLANPTVPASMNRLHEGVGRDHDSVGLFQQRRSWGSVEQRMDPHESAHRFYAELVTIPRWQQLAVTVAAQRVQRSAFPGAYAKHQRRAERIVDSIP